MWHQTHNKSKNHYVNLYKTRKLHSRKKEQNKRQSANWENLQVISDKKFIIQSTWAMQQLRKKIWLKNGQRALAGVAQWIEHWPANRRVAGSISGQGTFLGCPGTCLAGGLWRVADHCFSPSLSPSLAISLKVNKVFFKKWEEDLNRYFSKENINDQQVHEKVLNITNHPGNNSNHNKIPPHTYWNGYFQKDKR